MTSEAGKTRARDLGSGRVPNQSVSVTATASNPTAPAALSVSAATAALTATVPAITYTSNTPTPSDTQTINDGTVPTVAELGQFTADQEDLNLEVKADLAAQKVAIDALIADQVASRLEIISYEIAISALIADVDSMRTELVALNLMAA